MSSKKEKLKNGSQTPSQDESTSSQNQLSPRYSRLNEKKELAGLNDRLACYIDKVRNLENENARLTLEIRTSQETVTKEVTTVKTAYENELSATRMLLDDLSHEKAKLEIDACRLVEENVDLKENLVKKINECNSLQDTVLRNENSLSELSYKYNFAQQERIKLFNENRTLDEEKSKLASMVSKLQKSLEEEILNRIDLENRIKTIGEDFAFREEFLKKQLTESRNVKVTKVDEKITQEYRERHNESLQEIRDQYEIDIENMKQEIKNLYEEKLKQLEAQVIRNSNMYSFAREEMKQTQLKLDESNEKLAEAERERNIANQKARDLMKEVEQLKSERINEIAKHNIEVEHLREELISHVQKYEDLMDEKVALDLEIAAYGKLLEGEESRLNITPVTNVSTRLGACHSKRKRSCLDEHEVKTSNSFCNNKITKGDIELSEVDVKGKFIRLVNRGNQEISLSSWQIKQLAVDSNSTFFKFHRSIKINPGSTITVWSSDSGHSHEPPVSIVMKRGKWLVAEKVLTTLINNSGEEVASFEHFSQQSCSSISNQKNLDTNERAAEESCIIM